MLIQAQCQKDREKKCKIRANDVGIRNEQNASTGANTAAGDESAVDEADVEMSEIAELTEAKEEGKMDTDGTRLGKPTSNESENTTNNSMSTSKSSTPEKSPKTAEIASSKEAEPQESNESGGAEQSSEPINIEETVPETDSSIINIDPRTYCKLGHFHLLLEDYPKGNLWTE